MVREERLCDEMVTVREFEYLCDMINAGRGCEAAVTVRPNINALS